MLIATNSIAKNSKILKKNINTLFKWIIVKTKNNSSLNPNFVWKIPQKCKLNIIHNHIKNFKNFSLISQ